MKTNKLFFTIFAIFILHFFSHGLKANASVSTWQKGASFSPNWNEEFASGDFKKSIDNLSATNANYATLVIPIYQSNLYSTDIQTGNNTPTDQALISGILYAKSKGLKVTLKPHLQSYTNEWRAYINPTDREAWFNSYTNILVHYATIGQQNGASDIILGTELINMSSNTSNSTNAINWIKLIDKIRAVFSGRLSYSANWGPSGFVDEKNNIAFWNSLDYIGISAYFNLNGDNSVENLKNQWHSYNTSQIEPLSTKYNKPIVFTEIGYKSITGSHTQPWDYTYTGSVDQDEQQRDYQALFEYWNNYPYMQGLQLWEWKSNPNDGGVENKDYTPQNKTAEKTITSWFGGAGTSTPLQVTNCPQPNNEAFSSCYYTGKDFSIFKYATSNTNINFNWGAGSPNQAVPNDNFSARYQGVFHFETGSYDFTARADDGIRLFIDGKLIIDQWTDQAETTFMATTQLNEGSHTVTMEYYENTGNASANLTWNKTPTRPITPPQTRPCPAPASESFTACYYTGRNFETFTTSKNEAQLNNNWGSGSPDSLVPTDNFSAIWKGNFNFNAGNYTFSATADDGLRVLIDGNLIIDEWKDQAASTYTKSVQLTSGNHEVRVEYFENAGNALAKLSWSKDASLVPTPSPIVTQTSSQSSLVDIWWPSNGSTLSGQTPFKALLKNRELSNYNMYWQVDTGDFVLMGDSQTDYPHKEFLVNLTGWTWKKNGPYKITFLAKDLLGNILETRSIDIFVQ